MISELITFRGTKAKAKFGVKYLCGRECERSSTKAKAKKYFRGINFTFQKPGDHSNFSGVKRSFSELSESSGVFSEQLSEYEIPFSEWHPTT